MNNIVKRAIERVSDGYNVSILLNESDASLLPQLRCPEGVKMKMTKTDFGIYLNITGETAEVMGLEVELYDLLSQTYADCSGNGDYACAEAI